MANKPHMNIITAGHVDHGKSTLFGRILYESGAVRDEELKKLKDQSTEYKIEGAEFAYIADTVKEERQRGMTIDVSHRPFETNKYYFTVIDVPGHRDDCKIEFVCLERPVRNDNSHSSLSLFLDS